MIKASRDQSASSCKTEEHQVMPVSLDASSPSQIQDGPATLREAQNEVAYSVFSPFVKLASAKLKDSCAQVGRLRDKLP